MRRNRMVLWLIAAVMICLVVFCYVQYSEPLEQSPISLVIWNDNGSQTVELWQSGEEYYAFLPSYADLNQVQIKLNTDGCVILDETQLTEGMDCGSFALDTAYTLAYHVFGVLQEHRLTFVKSSDVSTIYIATETGSMEYIHEKKGNEESATFHLFTADGDLDYAGQLPSIKGRGNASWVDAQKKAYSIQFSGDADLLEMGAAQKWVLLANALDPSNLKNKIVYDFAAELGMAFTPDCKWVDLYLNGEYAGLYLLSERNEVHPQRVDVSPTGSFLVSSDLEERLDAQNYPYIGTDEKQAFRIHYPRELTEDSKAEVAQKLQSLENAILAEDGIDPLTGNCWLDLIDLDSWTKKYLIDEIFGNIDSYYISHYLYSDGNDPTGKVFVGPVWDYDISMGGEYTWQLQNPRAFFANRLVFKPNYEVPWAFFLCKKDQFYDRVAELYQTDYLPLLDQLIKERIDCYAETIAGASAMNQIRWSIDQDVFSYAEDIALFLTERLDFLSSLWIDNVQYYRVAMNQGFNTPLAHNMVPAGECLTELPEFADKETMRFCGWYYADTNEPFDITQPITEDIAIYAKWEETSFKRLGQILKLIPLGVIGIMGIVLLLIDIKRTRNSR